MSVLHANIDPQVVSQHVDSTLKALKAQQQPSGSQGTGQNQGAGQTHDETKLRQAAQKFEAMMLRELLKSMRQTAPKGGLLGDASSGSPSSMVLQMFDDSLADQLARSGDAGMADLIMKSLGASDGFPATMGHKQPNPVRSASEQSTSGQSTHIDSLGSAKADTNIQRAIESMHVGDGRWGKQGQLTREDLASSFQESHPSKTNHFNVDEASGYEGHYKCNLFALEAARRSGYQVPLVQRARGWGFPSANRVTQDASDGTLDRNWGRVVTGASPAAVNDLAQSQRSGILLTGSAEQSGRAGHMAIIEKIHRIDYENGAVKRVVFDGWEARTQGAQHLTQRTWNLDGNPGGHMARGNFKDIQLIELTTRNSQQSEIPLSKLK